MMKIAMTGATGLVGSRIVELLANRFTFLPLRQAQVDITNKESVDAALSALDYDLFLHLAAYTNVDGAEKEKEKAYAINADGTQNIMEAVSSRRKKLIYISTDFVFDGDHGPFYEDSAPRPISVYGASKYEGEKMVNSKAMIVRISYPYRKEFNEKKDFVRTIKSLLEQKKKITMVSDSLIVPTFIDDIAFSLEYLMNNFSPETYHIVGSKALSPFEAGMEIAKTFHLDETLISPVSYREYFAGKALRPHLSDIRSSKNKFYPMKNLHEGLQFMIKQ